MTWKIKTVAGPLVGQEINIDASMIIGRDQSVDIVLQGGHISRRHAELCLRDDQLWIKDLNSSNGTFVNDERISEQQLESDDQIQIDVVRFLVISTLQADNTLQAGLINDLGQSTLDRGGLNQASSEQTKSEQAKPDQVDTYKVSDSADRMSDVVPQAAESPTTVAPIKIETAPKIATPIPPAMPSVQQPDQLPASTTTPDSASDPEPDPEPNTASKIKNTLPAAIAVAILILLLLIGLWYFIV